MEIRQLTKRVWENKIKRWQHKTEKLHELKTLKVILDFYDKVLEGFKSRKNFYWPGGNLKGEKILYKRLDTR